MQTTHDAEPPHRPIDRVLFWYRLGSRLTTTLFIIIGIAGPTIATAKQPLTVREAIQTARFMVADSTGKSIAISPNGRRYAAMLIRGDIDQDGVQVEVIAGDLSSIETARPYTVARLFTRGLGATTLETSDSSQLLMPTTNFPLWIDDNRLAFLWEDKRGVHQVAAANVETRSWDFLTASETDVTAFGVGPHGTLIYQAKQSYTLERSDRLWQEGFTVTNAEGYSLLKGAVDGVTLKDIGWGLGEHFVVSGKPETTHAVKLKVINGGVNMYPLSTPSLRPSVSPDGRTAIVSGTPQEIPVEWNRYDDKWLQIYIQNWNVRHSSAARSIQQLFVVSVSDASARPLWNAPLSPMIYPVMLRWSPDSRSVLVWPVNMPIDSHNEESRKGDALVEIDVRTGRYRKLPLTRDDVRDIDDARWSNADLVEIQIQGKPFPFRRVASGWVRSQATASRNIEASIGVELRQGPNQPSALYAVDYRTGHEQMVFDPNPQLRREYTLGEVRFIQWRDIQGRAWEGRLFLPVGYQPVRRYPLVLQTHAWGRREDFTLYGQGSPRPTAGPSSSVYLAQPLANQGIAVLQVGPSPVGDPTPEAKLRLLGFISAIDYLDSIGLVDRDHVGIMGHSRSGWHTEFALAFSNFPFAAAIVDDNIDSGYFEAAMMGWTDVESRNGAEPFGAGLKDWLENAPAFNVEHIRSPLLMMVTDSFSGKGAPLAMQWEVFSRLRYLRKPAELWVAPNIERGSHNLQNPTQLLAQQERAMDWWKYWLKDERDSSEAKEEQYTGWDKLRVLRDEDAKRPEPPRLRWTAEPVAADARP